MTVAQRPGVILDRDGTIIDFYRDEELGVVESAFHPKHLKLLPGVVDGLKTLAGAGLPLAIATNQPGAAKGRFSLEAIARTNAALVEMLAAHGITIAKVASCLHHPSREACVCRKPLPGLLHEIAEELHLDAARTFMIGDAPVDLLAARAAGMRSALVLDPSRPELCQLHHPPSGLSADLVAPTIAELAPAILDALAHS